ncbi:MAG: hypothetical protein M0036_19145 [Desulfobacteraceae bacterium]|nr:hypothetical protein [Desulfobacteraceae bacterium]
MNQIMKSCGRCGSINEADQEKCGCCGAFLGPRKPVTNARLKAYVLAMATFAIPESIETDGLSLFWSEPGVIGQISTQMPSKARLESVTNSQLMVKYRNGKTHFGYYGASAAMVDQVLEIIKEDLRPVCGDYRWSLDGKSGDYRIIASWQGNSWVESTGKSPGECLKKWYPAAQVLETKYGIER